MLQVCPRRGQSRFIHNAASVAETSPSSANHQSGLSGLGGYRWYPTLLCHAVVLFLTVDQIQLVVLSAAAWSCCVGFCLAMFVSPSLVRYEAVVRPMKPRQPTSMGITWPAHPLSQYSMRRFSFTWLTLLPHPLQVQHIYSWIHWVSIGSDYGLSPARYQAITLTNVDWFSIGPWRTNFGEIRIKIRNFSFMTMHSKISPAKLRPSLVQWGDELTICMTFIYRNEPPRPRVR